MRSLPRREPAVGKNAMVQRVLAAAGLSEAERAAINANQPPVARQSPEIAMPRGVRNQARVTDPW
jgi:hypothetical protein